MSGPLRLMVLLAVSGCGVDYVREPVGFTDAGLPDRDNDGYGDADAGGSDCDDANPDVNPGVPERCFDQIDNDCDGVIDDAGEGDVAVFVDADRDGFGNPDAPTRACPSRVGEGFAPEAGDCNDDEATANPSFVIDLCDRIDNDCDGQIDEEGPVSVGTQAFPSLAVALQWAESQEDPVVAVCPPPGGLAVEEAALTLGRVTVQGFGELEDNILRSASGKSVVRVSGTGQLRMENLVVTGSLTEAAIQSNTTSQGSLELNGVVVRDNAWGGVLVSSDAQVQIEASRIEGNGGPYMSGGGIRVHGQGTVTLVDSTIEGNWALYGGGIHAARVGGGELVVHLINTDLVDNDADEWGGGLWADDTVIHLEGSTLHDNVAIRGGGAFLRQSEITGIKKGETPSIFGNQALDVGGGLSLDESEASQLTIFGNTAVGGGAVHVWNDMITGESSLVDNEIFENQAGQVAGAFFVTQGTLVVSGGRVIRNRAEQVFEASGVTIRGEGGALYFRGDRFVAENVDWGGVIDANQPEDIVTIDGDEVNLFGVDSITCALGEGCQ